MEFHSCQLLAPHLLGFSKYFIKIKSRHLGIHVGDRIFFADRRKRYFDNETSGGGRKVEYCFQSASFDALRVLRRVPWRFEPMVWWRIFFLIVEGVTRNRRGEADCKIELSPGRPSSGFSHSGHCAVLTKSDAGPEYLAGVVVNTAAQVEQYMALPVTGKL